MAFLLKKIEEEIASCAEIRTDVSAAAAAREVTTYFSVSNNALEFFPDFFGLCQVHLTNWKTNLANGIVFGKAVVVVHGEHEGLGHHLTIWNLQYHTVYFKK